MATMSGFRSLGRGGLRVLLRVGILGIRGRGRLGSRLWGFRFVKAVKALGLRW